MPQRLLNKVAVVTGAGSGIGRAIAERFIAEGAKVVVCGRRREPLEDVAHRAAVRVLAVEADVTRPADLQQLAAATVRRFGRVDVLVACAGAARAMPFAESTPEAVQEQFAINFLGAHQTVRQFLPYLNRGSSVIFITGALLRPHVPGLSAYSASKAALGALARALAVELAPLEVRVNCIAPGPVSTPFWDKLVSAGLSEASVPGASVRSDDIAEVAVFLASEGSRGVCGEELVVDAGIVPR